MAGTSHRFGVGLFQQRDGALDLLRLSNDLLMAMIVDQAELVASQAPRPYFIGAPLKDVGMPKEAVDELLAKVSPAYERAGAPGALVTFRPDGPHEFGLEMFAELVKFFDKYL